MFSSSLRHWRPEWGVRLMVCSGSPPDRPHRGVVPVAKLFSNRLIEIPHQVRSVPGREGTFSDVVVSHGPFSNGLLFHKLVHVEQYRQDGIPTFI